MCLIYPCYHPFCIKKEPQGSLIYRSLFYSPTRPCLSTRNVIVVSYICRIICVQNHLDIIASLYDNLANQLSGYKIKVGSFTFASTAANSWKNQTINVSGFTEIIKVFVTPKNNPFSGTWCTLPPHIIPSTTGFIFIATLNTIGECNFDYLVIGK